MVQLQGFNGLATGISMGCLLFGYSPIAPVPISLAIAGLVSNNKGRGCNALGSRSSVLELVLGGLTSTAVDTCLAEATPLFVP